VTVMRRTFGQGVPDAAAVERIRAAIELERTIAAFDDGNVVGTAGANTYQMTVPGGSLPTAGVTMVTVLTTHRRRGILTSLMRHQLDDVHDRGEPLAALYASEAPIYGRFGYGIAIFAGDLQIPRSRAAFLKPAQIGGQFRFVDAEHAVTAFMQVWERVRPGQPGMLNPPAREWRAELADPEDHRHGGSPHYRVVYEVDGTADGFALYRIRDNHHDGDFASTLMLEQLVAATADAYEALWRYCLGVDLTARVSADNRPVDEPLPFLLKDARAARMLVSDAVWLRLVDVEAALAGRSYASVGRLVVEVADTFCPWNAGRYEISYSPQGSHCQRTTAPADLELDVDVLAALYLGGNRFSSLHQARRVNELAPGAIARADAMFRTDRAPWSPSHF